VMRCFPVTIGGEEEATVTSDDQVAFEQAQEMLK